MTFVFVILQPTNFGITKIQHVIGTDHYQSKQFVGLKMIVISLHTGSSSQHFTMILERKVWKRNCGTVCITVWPLDIRVVVRNSMYKRVGPDLTSPAKVLIVVSTRNHRYVYRVSKQLHTLAPFSYTHMLLVTHCFRQLQVLVDQWLPQFRGLAFN